MSHYCEVCKLSLHSEIVLKEHSQGKKHKRNQVLYEKRRDLANRSVFTRGFPPKTDEQTLREYFSQFGDIQRILKDKDRGIYAIIEFSDDEALTKIFDKRQHVISGHRIVIKPREFKPPPLKPPHITYRVKCKSLPQSAECKARDTERILQRFNFRVDCLPSPANIQDRLLACNTVEEQMSVVYSELKLEHEDLEARQTLVKSLTELFRQFYAGCELHIFGSSANGFGTKGCDMDLFLDLRCSERLAEEEKSGDIQYPDQHIDITCLECPKCKEALIPKHKRLKLGGIKSLDGKEFPVSAKSLSEVTLFDKVKMLSRILNQFESTCNDALTIPSVRCPVVRFSHSPTSIKCDLSVNNRLALQNTQLLKLFCDLDPRVRSLVFTIRYWGKLREVSGNPVSGPRLTNYSLTLLVIFFLQNCQPPVLPTVEKLAELYIDEKREIIDGWDCSFCVKDLVEKSTNTTSAEKLLVEFFQFYCCIDFSNVVLLPRTGQIIPISDFYGRMQKGERAKHFKMGALSVQDPFVLDHNITLNVNDKVRLKLVDELKGAAGICAGFTSLASEKPGFTSLTSEKPGFTSLASDKPDMWGLHQLFIEASNCTNELFKSELTDSRNLNTAAFYVILKMSQLPEKMVNHLHKSADYRVEWVLLVCRFINIILKEVLMFEREIVSDKCADLETRLCNQTLVSGGEESQTMISGGKGSQTMIRGDEGSQTMISGGEGSQTGSREGPITRGQALLDIQEEDMCEECDNQQVTGTDCDMLTSDGQTLPCVSMEGLELTDQPSTSGITSSSKRFTMETTAVDVDAVKRCKVDSNGVGVVVMQTSDTDNLESGIEEEEPSTSTENQHCGQVSEMSENTTRHTGTIRSPPLSPLTYQRYETPMTCLSLSCHTLFRTWNGRRVVKRKLVNEGITDGLKLEKQIGKALCQSESPAKKPILQFTLEVQAVIEPGKTATIVTLKPGSAGVKEFTCFYPFFKTFLIKAVEKYLPELVPDGTS